MWKPKYFDKKRINKGIQKEMDREVATVQVQKLEQPIGCA